MLIEKDLKLNEMEKTSLITVVMLVVLIVRGIIEIWIGFIGIYNFHELLKREWIAETMESVILSRYFAYALLVFMGLLSTFSGFLLYFGKRIGWLFSSICSFFFVFNSIFHFMYFFEGKITLDLSAALFVFFDIMSLLVLLVLFLPVTRKRFLVTKIDLAAFLFLSVAYIIYRLW